MPETVLAGADGAPAVDAITGMPLTMEELLRRRGILAHKGVISPLNQGIPSPIVDNGGGIAPTAAERAINEAQIAAGNIVSPETDYGAASQNTSAIPVATATPGATPDDGSGLWPYIIGGGGLAAAAYAARRLRNRPGVAAAAATLDSNEATRRNSNMFRDPTIVDADFEEIPNERIGSNRRLDTLIDAKNVARAGEAGAGPKRLSGLAPVTDVSNDNLRMEIARRNIPRGQLQDYNTRAPVSTRMENAARQANQSRVQPPGEAPILLEDQMTDLTPDEKLLVKQVAARLLAERGTHGNLRRHDYETSPHVANRRANAVTSRPIRPPAATQGQALTEALAIVRRQKAEGLNVRATLPLIRRVGR